MTDEELRSLQEVEHHLSELTQHPGWGALVEFSNFRMEGTKKRVLNGNGKDYETYLKDSSWLRGIHDTLDAHRVVSQIVSDELTRRAEFAEFVDVPE